MVWNLFQFKDILILGKARSVSEPNLGCRRCWVTGWFDVLPKKSAWDMMHKRAHYCDEAANHQLPISVVFWIIQITSMEQCSCLNLMQICCLLSHFECDGHTVYMLTQRHLLPCWLVPGSHHCSCMRIPVHSPWLPGYLNVVQTIHYINNGWTFSRQTLYLLSSSSSLLFD